MIAAAPKRVINDKSVLPVSLYSAPTARFTNRPAQRASSHARSASRFHNGSDGTGW